MDEQTAIFEGLNPAQHHAVDTTDGPVAILAGAGSGKTTVLTRRTANLIYWGSEPQNILVVTFTNKAAHELRERLGKLIGPEGRKVVAGTFHSVALRYILRPYINLLSELPHVGQGIRKGFSILDQDDSMKLLREAFNAQQPSYRELADKNNFGPKQFAEHMTLARARGWTHEMYERAIRPGTHDEDFQRITAETWKQYVALCRRRNAIDFDDILVMTQELLRHHPHVVADLNNRFRYVMVDEYQDTNACQMRILDMIVAQHRNIGVVGDERQSIYKFRGADIKVILQFKERYPEANIIDMATNYRSTPSILDVANAVAGGMEERVTKSDMVSGSGLANTHKPRQRDFETDRHEAGWVAAAINGDIDSGMDPHEIAVLYRNRSVKSTIENSMMAKKVPYTVVGDTGFFQRKETRDALALIRVACNPDDDMAIYRLLDAAKMGVSSDRVGREVEEHSVSARTALSHRGHGNGKIAERVRRLFQDLDGLGAALSSDGCAAENPAAQDGIPAASSGDSQRPPQVAKQTRTDAYEQAAEDRRLKIVEALNETWKTWLLEPTRKYSAAAQKNRGGSDADAEKSLNTRQGNVRLLFEHFVAELKSGRPTEEILEDLALLSMETPDQGGEEDPNDHRVQLMTVHAAKGLEFKKVYLVGMEDETCPGEDCSLEDYHEEQRIFYVAVTRAKESLVITHANRRFVHGKWKDCTPSRFIEDIAPQLNAGVTYQTNRHRVRDEAHKEAAVAPAP